MKKTYKVKGTMIIDVEWEVMADDESEALSKFYAADARDIIDESIITDVNSENEVAIVHEATFVVKVTDIDYDISYGDVFDQVEERYPDVDCDSDEFDELVDSEIKKIRESLPRELVLEVTCEREDIEDYAVDAVSDETGWLINGCTVELLEIK